MEDPLIRHGILNSATAGAELADEVVALLRTRDCVEVDFAHVDRMTPSFANSFVMRVMREASCEEWRSRVRLLNAAEHVQEALDKSAQRFRNGIRLSDCSSLAPA